MNKFICPIYDSTFKYLWKNKDCRNWFTKLIKLITNEDLSLYTLSDPELNSGNSRKDYRLNIVFLKGNLDITEADVFNIEMYKSYSYANDIKSQTYMFKLMSSGYESGDTYKKRRGIQINFHDYECPIDKNLGITRCLIQDKNNNIEKDNVVFYDVYLPNFEGICYNKENELDGMLALLHADSYDKMREIASSDKEALLIVEELEKLSLDEKFIGVYDNEKVQRKLQNSAREEGYDEGYLDAAKKMLEAGNPIEKISECLDLPIEDIEKIIKENIN